MFQEVDIASGRVLLEWRSLDHIPISDSYWPVGSDWDYVHLNSIAVDTDGNLLVSVAQHAHRLQARPSQRCGGLAPRRQAQRLRGRLRARSSRGSMTLGVSRRLDHPVRQRRRSASRALAARCRRVRPPRPPAALVHASEPVFAPTARATSSCSRTATSFVGWGAQPYVSEFTPSGELVFDAQLGAATSPTAPTARRGRAPAPARRRCGAAARARTPTSTSAGTAIRAWRIGQRLSGQGLASGRGRSRRCARGFETVIEVPAAVTQLRVLGNDAAGRTLATSALVRV